MPIDLGLTASAQALFWDWSAALPLSFRPFKSIEQTAAQVAGGTVPVENC